MKEFTSEELKEYDGREGKIYVACDGDVYDVSDSYQWRWGFHQSMHRAGNDFSHEFTRAPHGSELLKRFPIVGTLKPDE